jgi:H+/Cl- antiporter ClcA/CBS domain-containing protein
MTVQIPPPQILPSESPETLSWSDRLTHLINQLRISPESLMLLSAFLIGGVTGISIAIFRALIVLIHVISFDGLWGLSFHHVRWFIPILPALGGLIVGVMRWKQPTILGQSWRSLLSDTREQPVSFLRPILKLLAAATSIGTGASLGTEGPSAEIGANVGALLGQSFQVSKERYRLLLGAGTAAGLAAGFNAPIAGVFFALEVVLTQTFTSQGASLLLLSAVVSSLIARAVFGVQPEFDLPSYQVLSNWEWISYIGLGVLASIVSLLYTQAIKFCQKLFQGKIAEWEWLATLPPIWQPVLGGLGVGLLALFLPQILGVGYGTVDEILKKEAFPLALLVALLGVKLIATALSVGSGLVGGIFAPALFLGACLGDLYGLVLNSVFPPAIADGIAPPAAYAMVGMAAVLAGSARAPLTSILLLFELTRNYLIILPLMAAVGVSVWLVERAQNLPMLDKLALPQMGIGLRKTDDREVLKNVTVAEFMNKDYLALPATMTLTDAGRSMLQSKANTALVLNDAKQLVGILSLTDLKRHLIQSPDPETITQQTLQKVCTTEVLYAYIHESVSQAIERMDTRGIHTLPVVAEENPRQILGILERSQADLAADWLRVQSLLDEDVLVSG